jgi:hypothetical protein
MAKDRKMTGSGAVFVFFVAGMVLLVDGLVVWGIAIGGYPWTANMFPMLAATAITVFGSLVIIRPELPQDSEPLSWQAIAWLIAILPLIYLLGFQIALPFYALLYALAKRGGPFTAILLAAGVALLVQIIFVQILAVPLERGWILEQLR